MICTKHLAMRFANGEAILYGDLAFDAGSSCLMLGASGCGKSTLLNMIAGILTPTEGTVDIDGFCISSAPQRQRDRFRIERIGTIFQDFKLMEDMTVEDNVRVLELEGVNVSGMDELLDKLGILRLKKRRVRKLSGGEKQRVAIARALIKKPSIILADEPTGNLNFEIGCEVMQLLTDAGRGATIIAVTHDDRMARYFDRVLDMNLVTGGRGARG